MYYKSLQYPFVVASGQLQAGRGYFAYYNNALFKFQFPPAISYSQSPDQQIYVRYHVFGF